MEINLLTLKSLALSIDKDRLLSNGFAEPIPQHEIVAWAADRIEALERQLGEAKLVPGLFRCAKCKLVAVVTNLHVHSGKFSAGRPTTPCSNGCGPLWPVTYADALREAQDDHEKVFLEARELRAERDALAVEVQTLKSRLAEMESK